MSRLTVSKFQRMMKEAIPGHGRSIASFMLHLLIRFKHGLNLKVEINLLLIQPVRL